MMDMGETPYRYRIKLRCSLRKASDRRAYTHSGSDRRADTYTGSDRRVYTYTGSKSEPESEPGNTYSDAGSSGRSGYGCNTHPDTDCHTFHNAER